MIPTISTALVALLATAPASASEDWMFADLGLDAGPAFLSNNLGQGLGLEHLRGRVIAYDIDWRWLWGRSSGFTQGFPMRFSTSSSLGVSADGTKLSSDVTNYAPEASAMSLDFAYLLGWSFLTGEIVHRVTIGPWLGIPFMKTIAPLEALGDHDGSPYTFGSADLLYSGIFTDAYGFEASYFLLSENNQLDLRGVYSLAESFIQPEYGSVWIETPDFRSGDPGNVRMAGFHYTRLTAVAAHHLGKIFWLSGRLEWSHFGSDAVSPASLTGTGGVSVPIDTGKGLQYSDLALEVGFILRGTDFEFLTRKLSHR